MITVVTHKASNLMVTKAVKLKTAESNLYTPWEWLKRNVTSWNAGDQDKLCHSSVADRDVK